MKISLKQAHIQAALAAFLANKGIITQGKPTTYDFTAGRGATGISVDIEIDDDADFAPQTGSAELNIPGFTNEQPVEVAKEQAKAVNTVLTSSANAAIDAQVGNDKNASTVKTNKGDKSEKPQNQVNTDPAPGTEVTTQVNKDFTAKDQALAKLAGVEAEAAEANAQAAAEANGANDGKSTVGNLFA